MFQIQSVAEAVSALKRRWWIVVLTCLLGSLAAVMFALNQPRLYQATAVVQLESAQIVQPNSTAATSDAAHQLRLIEQRLMARDNLIAVIDKYALFADQIDLPLGQKVFQLRTSITLDPITNAQQSWQPSQVPSGLIITVRLSDAQITADIANEFLAQVVGYGRERGAAQARDRVAFFATEEARVGAEIARLDDQIAAFKRANGDALPSGLASQRDQLSTLRDAELTIDQQLIELQSNRTRLREGDLNTQIQLLQNQKALILGRIAQIEALIAAAPEIEKEFNALQRQGTLLQEQYSVITRRKSDAEMSQLLEDRQQTERFEVLETALVPDTPVSRSRKRLAAMGAVASLVLGIGLVFVVEFLNPAIRTAAQLERQLGVQPVITVPFVRSRRDRGLRILAWIGGIMAVAASAVMATSRSMQSRALELLELFSRRDQAPGH